jgi:hypothetical protein
MEAVSILCAVLIFLVVVFAYPGNEALAEFLNLQAFFAHRNHRNHRQRAHYVNIMPGRNDTPFSNARARARAPKPPPSRDAHRELIASLTEMANSTMAEHVEPNKRVLVRDQVKCTLNIFINLYQMKGYRISLSDINIPEA